MSSQNDVQVKGRLRGRKQAIRLIVVAALIIPLLSACALFGGQGAVQEEERVLRIATVTSYGNQFDHLRSEYTDLFDFMNEHLEIEFTSAVDHQVHVWNPEEQLDPVEEMKKLMEGPNPPDIVMLSYEQLPEFINENLLVPLDPLINEHELDLSDFAPAVIEGLKSLGNDQLYALSPTFSSTALIYNRAIFDQHGVGYPQDGMTWDEIFDLARRVSGGEGDERTFGFSFQRYYYSDLLRSINIYSAPLNLSLIDESGERMTVNNENWARVWHTIIDLQENGIFPEEPDYSQRQHWGMYDYDAFMSGKLAMTLMSYYELDEIIHANQNADNIDGYEYIDWDVVTMPVHPEAPNVGGMVTMDQLFAINARAENREDAWRLIEFIHSEDWAKLRSRSTYQLLSRLSYIEPKRGEDYNVEAFTQLIPPASGVDPLTELYRRNPEFYQVEHIGRMKLNEVMEGHKTVEEALAEWETEGNAMLQQIKENADASGGAASGAAVMESVGRVIAR